MLNRLVYEKGAWTLHMLRGLIGMDAFRSGVRDYYQQYRGRNATTADFQRVMEQHSGIELGWFLNQWLRRPGMPAVDGGWTYDASAKQVRISIRQTQSGAAYRLPLEFAIDGDQVERVEMNSKEAAFAFSAAKEPSAVRLDPNTWLLTNGTFDKR